MLLRMCHLSSCSLLLLIVGISSITGQNAGRDPCSPNPCGTNTNCRASDGRAVCSCLPGHLGNPIVHCSKGECFGHEDCPYNQACFNSKCKDVCAGACGSGANCDVKSHVPVCSCPAGYTGDPFSLCRQFDPIELCQPSPCGINTKCDVINNVPTCSCLPGYKGSALQGCRPECQDNSECGTTQFCSGLRCRQACTEGTCGRGARCEVRNHKPVCSCPEGQIGNPFDSCRQECYTHSECPTDKPTCSNGKCIDPCRGVCGHRADCKVRGETAICSCPKDMTGDPFKSCRPFTKEDLCNPNPCGNGAVCQPGYDNTGKDRPVCTCPPGYVGNALFRCTRGECLVDEECSSSQFCEPNRYQCRDACAGQCGVGATCTPRNHIPVCACPAGYTGDATQVCSPLPQPDSRNYGRSYGRNYYARSYEQDYYRRY